VIGVGLGDLSKVPVYQGFIGWAVPLCSNVTFGVIGGIQRIYNGMEVFLSKSNVILNAKIVKIKRSPSFSRKPVEIIYHQKGDRKKIHCRDMIISFPPTLENLSSMDLTKKERNLFKDVSTRSYFGFSAYAEGPGIAGHTSTIVNVDPTQPYGIAKFPSITGILNQHGYSPVNGYAFSSTPIQKEKMKEIVIQELSNIPSSVTNLTLDEFLAYEYAPQFSRRSLAKTPSPFTRLNDLQGSYHTFYTGDVFSYPATHFVWEKSFKIVQQYWPEKR